MLVDQLYVDIEAGQPYFIRGEQFVKLENSPMAIRYKGGFITFNEHTVVLVESDKILLTREQFFERFPHLNSVQSCAS